MDRSAERLYQLRVHRAATELLAQLLSSVPTGFFLDQLQIYFHVPGKAFFQSLAIRHRRGADLGAWIVFLLSGLSMGRRFGDGGFPCYRSPCSVCLPRGAHGPDPELPGFLSGRHADSRLPHPLAYAARGFDSRSPHVTALLSFHLLHDHRSKDLGEGPPRADLVGPGDRTCRSLAAHTGITQHALL